MIEIPIPALYPVDETKFPVNGKDAVTLISYTTWDLLDIVSFTIRIPGGWTAASSLKLRIEESTPGQSLNHKWQAVAILVRPGTSVITAATITETFSTQYTSSATANLASVREMSISNGNQINTTAVLTGDLVTVQFSRIAASASEDGNAVKILDLTAFASGAEALSLTSCLGDVGEIINQVKLRSNDPAGDLQTDAEILGLINACQKDLAGAGLWEGSTFINVAAGTYAYTLRDIAGLSGLILPLFVRWNSNSGTQQMQECPTQQDFYERLAINGTGDSPSFYFWNGSELLIGPTPATTISNQILLGYTLAPTSRGCTDTYTLYSMSAVHTEAFIAYCLWQRARKDRTNPSSPAQLADMAQEYNRLKALAFAHRRAGNLEVRPYAGPYV